MRLTEQEALLNLRAVLELCAAGELRCSEKTARPSAVTVRRVAASLVAGDFYPDTPIAAFAWPLLIQAGGLARLDGGRLGLTSKGVAARKKPAAEVIRQLWQRWLTHALIDEFSRIDEIKGQRITNVLTSAKTRRQSVGGALSSCPPGEWVDVDELFQTMRRRNMSPTIARNDRALWKLYLIDPQYGSLGYDGHHRWEILEGRYTLAVLFEYAGTLGLLDLDYVHPVGARNDFQDNWGGDDLGALSHYDGLRAIRLTALGRYALGLTEGYHPLASDTRALGLKVLPNLDIVATGTICTADQLSLSAFGEQTSDRVWTVSAASLLAAIDSGRDLTELVDFLTEHVEHQLPGALTTLIGDVTRRVEQLTDLGYARVIECTDPAVAMLITHDRGLRSLCQLIGDRHVAVPTDNQQNFRKALLKLGYAIP
jgi:Helicase conserved C-terminal domain